MSDALCSVTTCVEGGGVTGVGFSFSAESPVDTLSRVAHDDVNKQNVSQSENVELTNSRVTLATPTFRTNPDARHSVFYDLVRCRSIYLFSWTLANSFGVLYGKERTMSIWGSVNHAA